MGVPLVEMVGREVAMLLTLLALGVGPAAWLGRGVDRTARLLLAPVLGLCLGICVCTTLIWFFPASGTWWVLPLLAGVSMTLAADRWRRGRGWPPLEGRQRTLRRRRLLVLAAQIAVVCLAVAGPITYTLADHGSVGPVAYRVADVDGYVMQADGMLHESLSSAAARDGAPTADLVRQFWGYIAHGYAWPLEASPVAADLDGLLGTGAVETQSSFLVAYMVAAALCIFAAVRCVRRRPVWAGPLAGSLFGGPLLLVLFFDGSEPALCGVAVLMAILVVGIAARADPSPANLVVLALAFSAMWATYPPYVAMVLVAAGLLGLVLGIRWLRGPRLVRRERVRQAAARGGLFALLAVACNPVGFYRGVDLLAHIKDLLGGQTTYPLTVANAPGWLVQSRGLYVLDLSHHSALSNLALAAAVPLIVVVVAAIGMRSRSLALVAAPIGLASLVLAVVSVLGINGTPGSSCSYCATRGLAPLSAVVIVLFCAGLSLLAASARVLVRRGALALAVLVATPVAYSAYQEISTFSSATGPFFLSSSVETALAHLPATGCTVIEGFAEAGPLPQAEQVLVYTAVDEHEPGRVSVATDYDENNGLEYFLLRSHTALPSRYYCPRYSTVVTRAPSIRTSRRLQFETGDIAVEQRARPLDVVANAGLLLEDTTGAQTVFVAQTLYGTTSPLRFAITGSGTGPVGQAALHLVFELGSATGSASVSSRRTSTVEQRGSTVDVCVDAAGRASSTATVQLALSSGTPVRLVSMKASPGACSAAVVP